MGCELATCVYGSLPREVSDLPWSLRSVEEEVRADYTRQCVEERVVNAIRMIPGYEWM